MPQTFVESPRFPEKISYGATGGPKFDTHIFQSTTGEEQRTSIRSKSKAEYNVSHGIRDKTDMDVLLDFFVNMMGRASGFRFKDWADYQLVDEQIGVGDGVTASFKITKTYNIGSLSHVRRLFKPVGSTIIVKVNGAVKTLAAEYTLDDTTGIITFLGPSVPALSDIITVTGEFDVPARFDTDHMQITHDAFLTESWSNIPIIEILMSDP